LLQLDVTDQKSIADAVASVTKDFGRLDVLINNAGIISHGDTLEKQLRETFETNTFGPALVTDAFQSLLEKSNDARLIYVSSDLGSIAGKCDPNSPYYKLPATAYRMSKAALNMLMACNQADLGPKGFKVWAFNPGYVVTNLSGTGEKGRQERIRNGAGDASVSAKALANVVEGKRDADVGKHVHKDGIHLW
jgi:NAD(P)-dependent dehydrogenase (short-subunit alcohol dehydrogenase family)